MTDVQFSPFRSLTLMIDAIDGNGRADRNGEQQCQRRGAEGSHDRFAPAPAPQPCGWANAPGADWFSFEEAIKVFPERLRRLVAKGRLFLQTFQAEGLQVGRHAGIEQTR